MRIATLVGCLALAACGGSATIDDDRDGHATVQPSVVMAVDEPNLVGAVYGRVSNARVPDVSIREAQVDVFDRFPVGATAARSLGVHVDLRSDGRFSVRLRPGTYWIGAQLGPFSTLEGPVVVREDGVVPPIELAPDHVKFTVVSRWTEQGPQLVYVDASAIHPRTQALVVRAVASVTDGRRTWPMSLTRIGGRLTYRLEFGDNGPIPLTENLTLSMRTTELEEGGLVRMVTLAPMSEGIRPSSPFDRTAGLRHENTLPLEWFTPEDASYSMVCVLADGGTFLLDGCDEAVTSPYLLDTSRLTRGRPYDLLIAAGRAVSNGEGTAINVDSFQQPLMIH